MNLIDLINGQMTSGVVSNISTALGESTDRTRAGITTAIPSLLSEFDNVAITADGARRLRLAVDDADDGMLGNMGRFSSRATSGSSGLGTLSSILGGGGLSSLTGSIGRSTGLSGQSTSALLGLLAPMILGVLKKALTSGTAGVSDIASLLASQRSNIAAAMPSGVRTERYEHDTYAPREAVPRIVETERVPRRERSSLSWIVPLALVAGALALLWNLARPNTGVQAGREPTETSQAQSAVDEPRTFSLDALKAKYSSAFQLARAEGVHFSQIQQHSGKLVLKGTAPSQEAANKVWSEIRRINPRMDDITADISVTSSTAPSSSVFPTRPQSPGEEAADTAERPGKDAMETARSLRKPTNTEMYTVQRGDTLMSISKHFYGRGGEYTKILDANREQISNRDLIEVGQKLTIPMQ